MTMFWRSRVKRNISRLTFIRWAMILRDKSNKVSKTFSNSCDEWLLVLPDLTLINNDHVVFDCHEFWSVVCCQHLWRGDNNPNHPRRIQLVVLRRAALFEVRRIKSNTSRSIALIRHFKFPNLVTIVGRSMVNDCIQVGPGFKLTLPVGQSRQGCHNQKDTERWHFCGNGVYSDNGLQSLLEINHKIAACEL